MSDVRIEPITRPFKLTLSPPGSKSLTNRVLVLAALSDGDCELDNVLFADDTLVMLECLARLGFEPQIDLRRVGCAVTGRGGTIPANSAELFCGNSGTTIRFLAALCALGRGTFNLDGIPHAAAADRAARRPAQKPGRADQLRDARRIPAHRRSGRRPARRVDPLRRAQSRNSSRPCFRSPRTPGTRCVSISIGQQTSWPYVAMTMRLMDEFGVTPELIRDPQTGDPRQIIIPRGALPRDRYAIEPDASNAAYFLAAAAIHPGSQVTIQASESTASRATSASPTCCDGWGPTSHFGNDSITVTGTDDSEGIEVDLSDMPDTAQTLAVVALFAEGPTSIRGLHTLRVKETDRIAALATELRKARREGRRRRRRPDHRPARTKIPPAPHRHLRRPPHGDELRRRRHPGGGRHASRTPECVNKTYPNYFEDLEKLITR